MNKKINENNKMMKNKTHEMDKKKWTKIAELIKKKENKARRQRRDYKTGYEKRNRGDRKEIGSSSEENGRVKLTNKK